MIECLAIAWLLSKVAALLGSVAMVLKAAASILKNLRLLVEEWRLWRKPKSVRKSRAAIEKPSA